MSCHESIALYTLFREIYSIMKFWRCRTGSCRIPWTTLMLGNFRLTGISKWSPEIRYRRRYGFHFYFRLTGLEYGIRIFVGKSIFIIYLIPISWTWNRLVLQ